MLDKFSLQLPDGWSNQTAYLLMGPTERDQTASINLMLDRDATADDLDEFANTRVAMLEESFGEMEILKNENITLDNGLPAREFVVKLSLGDPPVYRKHVWVLHDGVGYDFIGDFSKATLKTFGIDMLRIAGSLQTV